MFCLTIKEKGQYITANIFIMGIARNFKNGGGRLILYISPYIFRYFHNFNIHNFFFTIYCNAK